MQGDTLLYDTLNSRPLPKWLIDQKTGVNTYQPEELVMKEDNSVKISLIGTAVFIVLVVAFLTIYLNRKNRNQE